MYEGNAARAVETTPKELQHLYSYLSEQNSRFINIISSLEDAGHRLKDTRAPEKVQDNGPKPMNSDYISDTGNQLEFYKGHLDRLDNFVSKLQSLI